MSALETVLGLVLCLFLAYFAFQAVGDDWPLNLAVAVLAFVLAAGLVFKLVGTGRA